MIDPVSFTAVVLTGGSAPRRDKTVKSIEALNRQTYPRLQKILVNHGRSLEEIADLQQGQLLTPDWEVINFPINTVLGGDVSTVWRFPGAAAMQLATGSHIFFQSDDDFLADDFFERMANLFSLHPSALTATGLMVSWYYETDSPGQPDDGSWQLRSRAEPGINVMRQYFGGDESYNPGDPFSYVCRTDSVREVQDHIFEGGFPNFSMTAQVVSRGETLFDPGALMYWGRHPSQENIAWDARSLFSGEYGSVNHRYAAVNNQVLAMRESDSKQDRRVIGRFFRHKTALYSLKALLVHSRRSRTRFGFSRSSGSAVEIEMQSRRGDGIDTINYMRHVRNVMGAPIYSSGLAWRAARGDSSW